MINFVFKCILIRNYFYNICLVQAFPNCTVFSPKWMWLSSFNEGFRGIEECELSSKFTKKRGKLAIESMENEAYKCV